MTTKATPKEAAATEALKAAVRGLPRSLSLTLEEDEHGRTCLCVIKAFEPGEGRYLASIRCREFGA